MYLGYNPGAFPITESIAETILSIPIGPHLGEEDANFIVEKIKEFCA
jgi:dTDP-4-amino-4,6-dideoxygalactose transaminase